MEHNKEIPIYAMNNEHEEIVAIIIATNINEAIKLVSQYIKNNYNNREFNYEHYHFIEFGKTSIESSPAVLSCK